MLLSIIGFSLSDKKRKTFLRVNAIFDPHKAIQNRIILIDFT